MRAVLSLLLLASLAYADPPPVVKEEGQPVAANAERLLKALDFLGAPLPKATETALAAAIKAQDASDIQKALDEVGADGVLNFVDRAKPR